MATILELDLNIRQCVVEGQIAINQMSKDSTGRHLLSSTCITMGEVEYWLNLLESDIAEMREKARLLRLGERRDLYWAAFEFNNGGVSTWTNYAVTQTEFLNQLYTKYKGRPFQIYRLQRAVRCSQMNWEDIDISNLEFPTVRRITPSKRFDIFNRDQHRCRICGRSVDDGVTLEIDHIVPVSRGGDDRDENLWVLCFDCNRGKAAKELPVGLTPVVGDAALPPTGGEETRSNERAGDGDCAAVAAPLNPNG